MLNPKKYQDIAEIKRNQLRVYFIRTLKKKAKEMENKQHKTNKENNKCQCKLTDASINFTYKAPYTVKRKKTLPTRYKPELKLKNLELQTTY